MKKAKKLKNKKKSKQQIKRRLGLIKVLLYIFVICFAIYGVKMYINKYAGPGTYNVAKKLAKVKLEMPTAIPTTIPPTTFVEEIPSGFCLRVPVIFYHHIEPIDQAKIEGHAQLTVDTSNFENQMEYLSDNGYTSYFAEDLANALINNQSLPGKPVVITVDDGYSDFFSYGFPIIQKYNIKTSLFIPTGLIGVAGYMTWDNIRNMERSGVVNSYNHTWSHYSMGTNDDTKIEQEIQAAKFQLIDQLGKANDIFAYPYGTTSPEAINALQNKGFRAAFTTIPGYYQCDSYILKLRRTRIGNASLSVYGL